MFPEYRLLCISCIYTYITRPCMAPHFCCASAHMFSFEDSRTMDRGTADERGRCRPQGDVSGQFWSKSVFYVWFMRPSADRALPFRTRRCCLLHLHMLLCSFESRRWSERNTVSLHGGAIFTEPISKFTNPFPNSIKIECQV